MGLDDTTDKGRVIFPLNAGKTETDITDDSTTYDYGSHENHKNIAYMSTSVNPIFVQNNLKYENNIQHGTTGYNVLKNSANFMEIRKTSHSGTIANEFPDRIGNRILPTNKTLTSYSKNRDETSAHKLKVYDSTVTDAEINRRFTYTTTDATLNSNYPDDYPSTEEVGLDIENYDYFVLINPQLISISKDLSGNPITTSVRPHFAKITRIVTFDVFGDGIEFTPKYKGAIANNTPFEIYKGPAKTDTDVVAVSYGLRGDTDANTPKYDTVNICSRPTWYFYNDRLDEDNQLDYMTKYNATHLRWWDYNTTVISVAQIVGNHAQYQVGANGGRHLLVNQAHFESVVRGQSLFRSSDNVYIGNIEGKVKSGSEYRLILDYARVALTATTSSATYKIGKTIHNVLFRTEGKFNNTIENKGKTRLDATLVDSVLTSDVSASTNFHKWHTAFPNMRRHVGNLASPSTTGFDNNMTGVGKYITFEKANFKNNKITLVQDTILNSARNKMSQMAEITTLDNHGLQHLKIQEEDDLVIETNLHNDTMSLIAYEGVVSSHASVNTKFTVSDIRVENDLRHILSAGDVVLIEDYLYVVNVVSAPDASAKTQDFSITAKKTKTAKTWTLSATVQSVDRKTLTLTPYTGVLNTTLLPDTELDYTTQRLTIDGNTIDKEDTRLYKSRIVLGKHPSHVNQLDVGDKDNKFIKILEPNRTFYQRTSADSDSNSATYNVSSGATAADRFYYYSGGYNVSDVIFRGIVEDISSKSEHGMTSYKIVGRDETSKLLSKNVSVNTNVTNDIVHSTITPIVSNASAQAVTSGFSLASSNTITAVFGALPRVNSITINQAGELIGEVKQVESDYSGSTDRLTYYEDYSTPTTTTSIKHFHPISTAGNDATHVSHLAGLKALQSDNTLTESAQDFGGLSKNGLIFNDGFSIESNATGSISTSDMTYNQLERSSNVGTFESDRSLGFDISSPKAISTGDGSFALQIGNENGVSIDKSRKTILAAETLDIVNVDSKEEGNSIITVAPKFPMVLGRIDTNTSDVRGNAHIYMVNRNINTGGFIHRLNDTYSGTGYYKPKETIRYWDLHEIKAGNLTRNHDSIYLEGRRPQQIQGYAVGYGVKADGSTFSPTATTDSKPLAGSNTLKGWAHLDNFYTYSKLPESSMSQETIFGSSGDGHEPVTVPSGSAENDILWDTFEQIDPRAETYELLAVGDLYPYSHLRYNNMGYHDKGFDDFGILLESEARKSGEVQHEKYDGTSKKTLKTDNMFEESAISSATVNTNQMKRWGVMKLVEATFDWHFNPVDYHTLPDAELIPPVRYTDYITLDRTPTELTSTLRINWDSDGAFDSANTTVTGFTDGDVYYQKTQIGEFPESDYYIVNNVLNDIAINGFVAGHVSTDLATTSGVTFTNNLGDPIGASGITNLLKFGGGGNHMGVQATRIFRTTDFNLDNLDSVSGNILTRTERKSGAKDIRFSHVWLCTPTIESTNFRWAAKLVDDSDTSQTFKPHNIILPMIFEETAATYSAYSGTSGPNVTRKPLLEDRITSPHHIFLQGHLHMSRVVAGLRHKTFSNSNNLDVSWKQGTGQSAAGSLAFAHIYDNCIGVFRGFQKGVETGLGLLENLLIGKDITISTPLELDTDTNYSDYLANNATDIDQHTRNLMVQTYGLPDNTTVIETAYSDGDTKLYVEDNSIFSSAGKGFINGRVTFNWTSKSSDGTGPYLTVPDLNADYAVDTSVSTNVLSLAMVGTRSTDYLLADYPKLRERGLGVFGGRQLRSRVNHNTEDLIDGGVNSSTVNNTLGTAFSAQMLVKPVFDITNGSRGVSVSGKEITFTLDSSTKHAWLSYLPNLTGYYLVSEDKTISQTFSRTASQYYGNTFNLTRTLRNDTRKGTSSNIVKILDHSITTEPSMSAVEAQKITLDTAITSGKWRLMRPSEVTFDDLEDRLTFNIMLSDKKGRDWRTGGKAKSIFTQTGENTGTQDDSLHFSESVYHMYLLLDIDKANSTIERRTASAALSSFSSIADGTVMDVYVTDGVTSDRKEITINKSIKGQSGQPALEGLEFKFDGKLNGSGVVSFGQTFDIELSRKPKLDNIKQCHIGTTFSIGSQIESEIEHMVGEAGFDYDAKKSFSTKTGNIVNSTTSDTVVCTANVSGIVAGDVVYSYNGHVIGEVQGVSSATITFTTNLLYTPLQYDELTLENNKTFVTNVKFDDVNIYDAINALTRKKGLDYKISGKKLTARNIEDVASLRKYSLSYRETDRLISVKSNKSMFDKANKAVVIGDRVKFDLAEPTKKQERVVKVIDPSIKTVTDAKVRALELLNLHSEDVRKIQLTVQKKGLEMLEAGDIVNLDFPNHNIPKADYIVFEIENVLSGTTSITVGTFDKTIAERLSEINTKQDSSATTLFKKDSIDISSGTFLFDEIDINVVGIEYTITGGSNALSYNSNMGFDDLLGFTETVGFATSTVTKAEYNDRFFE
jgi:hypothetical protein